MTPIFSLPPRPSVSIYGSNQSFPVHRIFCVGRNFAAHAREMGGDDRQPPFFFTKPASAIVHGLSSIEYPMATQEFHHEVEPVIALSRAAKEVSVEDARECIFGFAVGLDLTRRDLQTLAKATRRPWAMAKGFDQSAPIGMIHPKSSLGPMKSGAITLKVNGKLRQQGDLKEMIWRPEEALSQLSHLVQLLPGDLIFMGTPAGVSALNRGDQLEGFIEGLSPLKINIT